VHIASPFRSRFFACLHTLLTGGLLLALILAMPAHAQKETDRSKQKKEAESERADLRRQLSTLKREIDRTTNARSSASDALAASEAAISDAQRNLRNLGREQRETEQKLADLTRQMETLQKTVEARQSQLADLLREQYVAGNEDRIKLLLSGDNPNRINRDLQYMGYVSRAQATLIESLRADLHELEKNREKVSNAKAELDEIAAEAREQHAILQKEKAQHTSLLAQLSSKLAAQRKQAGTLERDERRLSTLVSRLNVLIEQQRKAAAAAAEKRRQQQLARARAERERRAAAQGGRTPSRADAIEDDEPPAKAVARNSLVPEAGMADGAFASLRGKLRLPIAGDIIARFGSRRGDGPSWKGLFIRAAEGTEVRAVATGRVVFADWLRGFGNLIIVDHGGQYMTIYGNNQAVLKQPGDIVKAGDAIASTGRSGGNDQSGLYFEMRHNGRAFDPLKWVTVR